MDGIVYNIQRMSTKDGPGLRTTVFLKGCPLHCPWCSNPESQSFKPQLMFFPIYAWGAALASGFARTVPWSRSAMCTTGIVRSARIAASAWKAAPPRRGKCPENA